MALLLGLLLRAAAGAAGWARAGGRGGGRELGARAAVRNAALEGTAGGGGGGACARACAGAASRRRRVGRLGLAAGGERAPGGPEWDLPRREDASPPGGAGRGPGLCAAAYSIHI
ncbi:shadow of prion protein-like [Peromyscus leucopus]|uniref:shadow of prion protein-like n=1 Tax=Peromyscus leucopus TaxID=10041 RepID=UPI0010A153BB|nr:shadow of prion protein-like [Peromyscus leucopus]